MKLYHHPQTRSSRPRWLLEELGVDYDLVHVDLKAGAHKTAEYLQIHPLGQLPALEIDGEIFIESVAICLHLTDLFPAAGLTPPLGSVERGRAYQWSAYTTGTLEPRIVGLYRAKETDDEARVEAATRALNEAFGVMDRALSDGRPWLCGARFTVADILCGTATIWAAGLGVGADFEFLAEWMGRLQSRDALKRAVRGT